MHLTQMTGGIMALKMPREEYVETVLDRVRSALTTTDLDLTVSPEDTAEAMVEAIPHPHHYSDVIGTFVSSQGARNRLGLKSRQALASRVRSGHLLRAKTSDGHVVYPSFQFSGGEVHPRLVPLLVELKDVDGWAAALWLSVPNPDLDGQRPRDWVRNPDHDLQRACGLAAEAALAWSAP